MPRADRTGARTSRQTARLDILGARLKTRLWLEVDGRFALGDGGIQLLLGVRHLGSLAAAVRRIGWSYRHAWGYLRRAETVRGPLTATRPGKGRARGTVLTALGDRIVSRLLAARQTIDGALGHPADPLRRRSPRAAAQPPTCSSRWPAIGTNSGCPNFSTPKVLITAWTSGVTMKSANAFPAAALTRGPFAGFTSITE